MMNSVLFVNENEAKPLVRKIRRGEDDLRRRGMKWVVKMWVPATFVLNVCVKI